MTTAIPQKVTESWALLPTGIVACSTQGGVLFSNQAAQDYSKHKSQNIKDLADIWGPDTKQLILSQLIDASSPKSFALTDENLNVICQYLSDYSCWLINIYPNHNESISSQFKALINQAESSVLILDGNHTIDWANDQFLNNTGIDKKDIIGLDFIDWLNQVEQRFDRQQVLLELSRNKKFTAQIRHEHPIFGEYWSNMTLKPSKNEFETQYLLIETDATNQVILKEELNKSYGLQQTILNNANLLIITTNLVGHIKSMNHYAEEILKCSARDIVGNVAIDQFFLSDKSQATLNLPCDSNVDDSLPLSQKINQHCIEKPINDAEWSWVDAKNASLAISCSVAPITLEDGTKTQFLYVGKDISKVKRIEARNRQQRELLQATNEMGKIGGWEYDYIDNKLTWSDGIYDIHELPRQSPIDVEKAIEFYTGSSKEAIKKAVNLGIQEGESWDLQCTFRTFKGNDIWVRAVGERVSNEDKPRLIRGTLQDITQLKMAEEKALENSKAKSAFLANMSHEIRTPINGIVGMHELISVEGLNAKQQEYLDLAKESSQVLIELINDILDVSKIEAGKLETECIAFDLHALLSNITKVNQLRAQEKGLSLNLHIVPLTPNHILGDPVKVRQILNNLLTNAVKFTDAGEVQLNAQAVNNQIIISVEDSGIGIPEEKLEHLFQPFVQADSSTTRRFGGTGLGLTISRQLANLMDGNLSATSQNGEGSKFVLTLPQLSLIENDNITTANKRLNLLLVSESLPLNQYWKNYAKKYSYGVQEVANAKEAMAYLKTSNLPNLIVIQNELEGMSGIELCKKIASHPVYSASFIVGTCARWGLNLAREFDLAGANALYTPTMKYHQLNRRVLEAIGNRDKSLFYTPVGHVERQKIEEPKRKSTKSGHILLVEDNKINQLVAAELLQNLGYSHDIANNGLEALSILREQNKQYSLILMDCQMPIMDGYETSQRIRSDKTLGITQHIPIIALTANAMNGDKQKCHSYGMNGYISKPVTLASLDKEISRLLHMQLDENRN